MSKKEPNQTNAPVRKLLSPASLISVALRLATPVLALLLLYIASRGLTAEEFGYFAIILTLAQLGWRLLAMGHDGGALRWLPEFAVQSRDTDANDFLGTSLTFVAGASLLTIAVVVFLPVDTSLPIPSEVVLPSILAASGLAVTSVAVGALRTRDASTQGLLLNDIAFRALFILGMLSLQPGGLRETVYVFAASIWIAALWGMASVYVRHGYRMSGPKLSSSVIQSASLRNLWGVSLVNGAMGHSDVLVLAYVLPPEQVGAYAVAKRLAMLVALPLQSANFLIATWLTRAHAVGDLRNVQQLLRDTVAIATVPALLGTILGAVFPLQILGLLLVEPIGYEAVLIILLITQLLNCAFGATATALTQLGGEQAVFKIKLTALFVSVALVSLGGLVYGVIGASLGTLVATTIWNAWIAGVVWRRYSVDTTLMSLVRRSGGARE